MRSRDRLPFERGRRRLGFTQQLGVETPNDERDLDRPQLKIIRLSGAAR